MTFDDILTLCRERPYALTVIIPFRDADGNINRLKVENPYFDELKCEQEMVAAAERLREAPKRLKELSDWLMGSLGMSWADPVKLRRKQP